MHAAPAPRPLPLAAFALAALSPVVLIGLGVALGGAWLWAAFLYMAVLSLLLDQLIPLTAGQTDAGQTDATEFPAADALLVAVGLSALALLPLATWGIAGPSDLSTGSRCLLFFATGFWLGQVGHPAAHELIHRPRREHFRLGAAVYTALLFGQHASAHRLVHHRHVASGEDPNTARAGEGFYRFALRAWNGSFRQGLLAERALRQRANHFGLNPYVAYVAGGFAALALAVALAGLPGLLAWVGLALHAQSQILLSDYVQHYGLTRARRSDGKIEPVGPAHSWNTAHWFTSAMMLNAPRHSDHHVHPGRPFPALRLTEDAPLPAPLRLPPGFGAARLPPAWRNGGTPDRIKGPPINRLRTQRLDWPSAPASGTLAPCPERSLRCALSSCP
jgi:alkane 1-monooxygenase